MGKVTVKVGAAVVLAAAGLAVSHGVAGAEPPAGQQVRYTLVAAGGAPFDVYYLAVEPPSQEAYDADPYAFLKHETIGLAPGVPWVFETTLSDPHWAILTASSTTRGGQAAPNGHCDIAVDGQVVVQQDAPYNLQCQLKTW
ncbi:hypothetical protein [Mycolicibacterium mengxianglii]|uniref:hypothetical protein n=1 Tax=Mycolicibacterium mengxianglii TaxID=2736649 RepID=UPI001E505F7C|nr:hypothetical protein [Mycolicibacterium mengxianglii]